MRQCGFACAYIAFNSNKVVLHEFSIASKLIALIQHW